MSQGASGFYSTVQVGELDRLAVASGISGYSLMQRAAAACWRELTRRWPQARSVTVVCGPGKNGGDGYELARLARAAGWTVQVWQVGSAPEQGDAASAREVWISESGAIQNYNGQPFGAAEVLVDAIFGTGLSRAPEGITQTAIVAINALREQSTGILAVDVPSGLDADCGSAPGDAVRADLTVSFIGRKPGLHTGQGPDYTGSVVFDDLQVPADIYRQVPIVAEDLEPSYLPQVLPRRLRTTHKGQHGHVVLVGGDTGMAGAILLAARAALRAGAGRVSVATRAAHAAALTAAQPEVMFHGVEDARALRGVLERATVVALGPGLGRDGWARELWSQVLNAPYPLVVDADGLNWLAENPHRREDWVLTPHPGEAARLLACSTSEIQTDRIAAVKILRERDGGVGVLKGAGTLVQGEALALCPLGNPGMAMGGMGDVLCGLIAGLLAQGLAPETAARAGVLAHALAGDRAAISGERGLLPGDLLDGLRFWLNP
ncbi:MAG: NAD(P)H-hydrate dehydratase [Nevskiales bacterium]|nr:NAD(P)H-hydrate dehydratase [Nevskiales bacterium]